MATNKQFENNFQYHKPTKTKTQRYEDLRETAKQFAYLIEANVPQSRERSVAITKLEEVVMWANAGIARNPDIDEVPF